MVTVTITVLPAQVLAIRAALLTLYRLEAESLQDACDAHLREHGSSAALSVRREMLLEVDAAAQQAGWDLGEEEPARVSLTASDELLAEALYTALLEMCERLDVAVRSLGNAAGASDPRAVVRDLAALLELYAEVASSRGGKAR